MRKFLGLFYLIQLAMREIRIWHYRKSDGKIFYFLMKKFDFGLQGIKLFTPFFGSLLYFPSIVKKQTIIIRLSKYKIP